MSESAHDLSVPPAMPVLSRGKHRTPARGACFMEYTSLLADEPFTDAPDCVDPELAAILRGVNDKLSDADRPLLVPLLGRAVGMTVGPRPPGRAWSRSRSARRERHAQMVRYESQVLRLRRAVSRRFMSALGTLPSSATDIWSGCGEEVSWLFWDLMDQPNRLKASDDHVRRMVDRLHLLHACYEEAMAELGIVRSVRVESVPDQPVSPFVDR
jgi:hypothetical protein